MNTEEDLNINRKTIFAMGCRFLAIWFLLDFIIDLPAIIEVTLNIQTSDTGDYYAGLAIYLISITGPIILLLGANWISEQLIAKDTLKITSSTSEFIFPVLV